MRILEFLVSVPLMLSLSCQPHDNPAIEGSPRKDQDDEAKKADEASETGEAEKTVQPSKRAPKRWTCPPIEPPLPPVAKPKITPRNRALRFHRLRAKTRAAEVISMKTYRVLQEVGEDGLRDLRTTPEGRKPDTDPNESPAMLTGWDVAILLHVEGEELPFLGHLLNEGDLYFVEEGDPWDLSVHPDGDSMRFRRVNGVPLNFLDFAGLERELEEQFGEADPYDKLAVEGRRRCAGDPSL